MEREGEEGGIEGGRALGGENCEGRRGRSKRNIIISV